MTEYKYRVENDPHTGERHAFVENVGFVPLNESEGEDKVKSAIASAHNLDVKDVEVKEVKDDFDSGVVTSDQVGNDNAFTVDDLKEKRSKKNK